MHALLLSLYLSSIGLIVVLLARKLAQRLFGAGPAFSLWLLPLLLALTPWLPAMPTHWSAPQAIATLPGVRTLFTQTTITVRAAPSTHWLLWLWLAGSALMLVRLIVQHWHIRRGSAMPSPPLLHALRPMLDQRHLHRVRIHPMGPAVLWSTRSQMLLPDDFMQRFSPAQQRAVIAHEATHLRRGDAWWNLLAELGLAMLWFHPLAWIALPRLRLDMELACDAAVLRRYPGTHATYAQALLRNADVPALPNLVSWFNPPQLKERLIMIARPQSSSLRRRCGHIALAMTLATGTLAAQALASTPYLGSPLAATANPSGVADNGMPFNGQPNNMGRARPGAQAAVAGSTAERRVTVVVDPGMSQKRRDVVRQKMNQAGISHVTFATHGDGTSTDSSKHSHKIHTFEKDANASTGGSGPTVIELSRVQNPPVYPDAAKRAKAQGTVQLDVFVTTAGDPLNIQIAQSSGYQTLDHAAINAAQKWRFSPEVHNGKPVAGWTKISVNFQLDEFNGFKSSH